MSSTIKEITGRSSFINRKTFEIETLTPVHIGSGRDLVKNIDSISSNNHTLVYDIEQLIQAFGNNPKFTNAVEQGSISDFLKNQGIADIKFAQSYPGKCNGLNLSEQLTDGRGKPIIPGSSLKGACKTALFWNLFDQSEMDKQSYFDNLRGYYRDKKNAGKLVQNNLFAPKANKASTSPNWDIGRVIRFSDASFKKQDLYVFNNKILNLGKGNKYGWKKFGKGSIEKPKDGSSIYTFGIDFEKKGKMTASLDTHIRQKIEFNKELTWDSLAKWNNEYSNHLIEYELNYFKSHFPKDPDIDAIKEDINNIISKKVEQAKKETNNGTVSFVMRVGWGIGWHSMTGAHVPSDWLPDIRRKYRLGKKGHTVFPKTRRIAMDGEIAALSWGWIMLKEV